MEWKEALEEFAIYLKLERGLSQNTLDNYMRDLKKLYVFYPNIPPSQISTEQLRAFNFEVGKKYAASSQSRILSGIRSFYHFLNEEEITQKNPSDSISSPKIGRTLPDTLSEEEINRIVATIDLSSPHGERNRAILEMLYGCGLRVSELVELKLSDLFLEDGFIQVLGKGNKKRLVPIADYTKKILNIYLQQVRVHLKINPSFSDHIFINNRGAGLSRSMIFRLVKSYAKLADIKKNISPHTFRHSFATHLLKNGADLRSIQMMLGHESITTTEIYTHIDREFLRDNINKYHPKRDSFI